MVLINQNFGRLLLYNPIMDTNQNSKTQTKQGVGSTQPYLGTKDFIFKDFERLNFIFENWRKVCTYFGFNEYILPVVEPAMLYKAKSGEELGNKQLYEFVDKGGRQIAIRPEATPGITRVISKYYRTMPKPIRVFSILNFMRYERPQAGRMREFFQLNVDMFGAQGLLSDLQILMLALEIFLVFTPPKDSFVIYINSRKLVDQIFEKFGLDADTSGKVLRFIDKFGKITQEEFNKELTKLRIPLKVRDFLQALYATDWQNTPQGTAFNTIRNIVDTPELNYLEQVLTQLNADSRYKGFVYFNPTIVRGLDYYDGIVFEAFDTNPNNRRALLGGGRYNSLGPLFGIKDMPAIGFGAGNYTFENWLDNWNLWQLNKGAKPRVFVPILEGMSFSDYSTLFASQEFKDVLARQLGTTDVKIILSTKYFKVTQALRFANKQGFDTIVLYGDREKKEGKINVKVLKEN